MAAPRLGGRLATDAVHERMKRSDILSPLARSGPPHFGRSTKPRFRPRQQVNEEVSNRLEPKQPRIHRDVPAAESERELPRLDLSVAQRDAQMVSDMADHLRRRHRSPTGVALRQESVDPRMHRFNRSSAEERGTQPRALRSATMISLALAPSLGRTTEAFRKQSTSSGARGGAAMPRRTSSTIAGSSPRGSSASLTLACFIRL